MNLVVTIMMLEEPILWFHILNDSDYAISVIRLSYNGSLEDALGSEGEHWSTLFKQAKEEIIYDGRKC